MSDWVLTADRKPTADDAMHPIHKDRVHVQDKEGRIIKVHYTEAESYEVWRPLPEPYKPPVPVRWTRWVVLNKHGAVYAWERNKQDAIEYAEDTGGRAFLASEVRDGDPSPEDVEAVRQLIVDDLKYHEYDDGIPKGSVRNWLNLLGGKP